MTPATMNATYLAIAGPGAMFVGVRSCTKVIIRLMREAASALLPARRGQPRPVPVTAD
jgi:hypothetical protein